MRADIVVVKICWYIRLLHWVENPRELECWWLVSILLGQTLWISLSILTAILPPRLVMFETLKLWHCQQFVSPLWRMICWIWIIGARKKSRKWKNAFRSVSDCPGPNPPGCSNTWALKYLDFLTSFLCFLYLYI